MLLGLAHSCAGYDHNTRQTLYLSRHSLWSEKETIDDKTQTIPLALIQATCHRDLEDLYDHPHYNQSLESGFSSLMHLLNLAGINY